MSLAAHPGRPEVLTGWLDPSVTDETDPTSVDPALDMFDPGHGPPFGAELPAPLPGRAAGPQPADHRLGAGRARPAGRARGPGPAVPVPRSWADLRIIDAIDRAVGPAVPNWCYLGDPMRANYGVFGVGTVSTLRSWLSMWSLRTSQCTAAPHLARITLPALVIHATADTGVYSSDARALYDALAAPDKTLEFIKADHYLQEPDGARAQAADLIAAWVTGRV